MRQKREPVTAKVLAIDLDSRTSTASELLERMAAQGLVTRDPGQRPREYTLTTVGEETLLVLPARDSSACNLSAKVRIDECFRKLDSITQQLADIPQQLATMLRDVLLTKEIRQSVGERPGSSAREDEPASERQELVV